MNLTERFKNAASEKLKTYLPDRTKRLILLASIYGMVVNREVLRRESIKKLNELMELSSDDNAIMFPVHISKVIWRNKGAENIICGIDGKGCEQTLAKSLVDIVPNCLKYSTYEQMLEDIQKLLSNKTIFA